MQTVLFGMGGEDRLITAIDRINEIGGMDILTLGVKTISPGQNPTAVPGPDYNIVV